MVLTILNARLSLQHVRWFWWCLAASSRTGSAGGLPASTSAMFLASLSLRCTLCRLGVDGQPRKSASCGHENPGRYIEEFTNGSLLEEKRRVNYNGSTRQSYSIYHRENSLVATVTYSNPLIAIQKYLFPSLPFVYVSASPGCHSVKFLDHGVKFPLPHSMTCGPTRSSPSSHHLLTFPSLCGGYVPAAAEAELAPARGRGGSKRPEWSSCCAPCRVHRRG